MHKACYDRTAEGRQNHRAPRKVTIVQKKLKAKGQKKYVPTMATTKSGVVTVVSLKKTAQAPPRSRVIAPAGRPSMHCRDLASQLWREFGTPASSPRIRSQAGSDAALTA
jgi:hypothetical protein